MKNVLAATVALFMFLTAAVIVGNQGRILYLSLTPPITTYTHTLQRDTITPGDSLVIEYTVNRNRFCNGVLGWYITRITDGVVIWRHQVLSGAANIGDNHIKVLVSQPVLEPGEYSITTLLTQNCVEGIHSEKLPPLLFTVI